MLTPSPGQNNSPSLNSNDLSLFENVLLDARNNISISSNPPGVASITEVNNVIKTISDYPNQNIKDSSGNITPENLNRAILGIVELSLRGGTSPKFSESATSSISRPIIISQKQFKESCIKNKTTTRKVARALKHEAIAVAKAFEIPGNLSKAYKLQNPNASLDELIYCNDFFTFSFETEMPTSVHEFLLENYNARFRGKK